MKKLVNSEAEGILECSHLGGILELHGGILNLRNKS